MKKKKKKRRPHSGDALVDVIFEILIDMLEERKVRVRMKDKLFNPGNKKRLDGYIIFENGEIFLKRNVKITREVISSMIHEIWHYSMPFVYEDRIRQFEKRLMVRLTDEQKRFLKNKLPRYTVKKEPEI